MPTRSTQSKPSRTRIDAPVGAADAPPPAAGCSRQEFAAARGMHEGRAPCTVGRSMRSRPAQRLLACAAEHRWRARSHVRQADPCSGRRIALAVFGQAARRRVVRCSSRVPSALFELLHGHRDAARLGQPELVSAARLKLACSATLHEDAACSSSWFMAVDCYCSFRRTVISSVSRHLSGCRSIKLPSHRFTRSTTKDFEMTASRTPQPSRIALITGGGRGLGRSAALASLPPTGSDVILTYRSRTEAERRRRSCPRSRRRGAARPRCKLDVGDAARPSTPSPIQLKRGTGGHGWQAPSASTVLVNNAGVGLHAEFRRDTTEAQFDDAGQRPLQGPVLPHAEAAAADRRRRAHRQPVLGAGPLRDARRILPMPR
jgi:hypothetical protein